MRLGERLGGRTTYAAAFAAFSAGLLYLAWRHGGLAWLLVWPAVSFAIVAGGYALLGPRVMGKNHLGEFSWWSRVLLLPFRLFVLLGWYFGLLITRGPASCEVVPGVWLGRRVPAGRLPRDVRLVIDLTSEMSVPRRVRDDGRRYMCVPALDYSVPDVATSKVALDEAARVAREGGGVYIHCAQGFGRSASLVAAMLIARGECRDVNEAERRLRSLRPGVRLNREQRAFVTRLTTKRDPSETS